MPNEQPENIYSKQSSERIDRTLTTNAFHKKINLGLYILKVMHTLAVDLHVCMKKQECAYSIIQSHFLGD